MSCDKSSVSHVGAHIVVITAVHSSATLSSCQQWRGRWYTPDGVQMTRRRKCVLIKEALSRFASRRALCMPDGTALCGMICDERAKHEYCRFLSITITRGGRRQLFAQIIRAVCAPTDGRRPSFSLVLRLPVLPHILRLVVAVEAATTRRPFYSPIA